MNSSRPQPIPILGVNIDRLSFTVLLDYLTDQINHHQKLFLTTPNPEIILKAHHDPEYKQILNSSDIAIPDGIGLLAAAKYLELTKKLKNNKILHPLPYTLYPILIGLSILFHRRYLNVIPEQISGDLLFPHLIKLAKHHHWRIFLLGGKPKAAELTAQKLTSKFQILNSNIMFHPGSTNIHYETPHEQQEIIQTINRFQPHLLFVAYGAPWQERWVHANLSNLKVNLVMGIGGTLDDFAGLNLPTPSFLRNLGLRWLWRLITQPSRFKRIWNAVIVFPWITFKTT